MWLLPTLRKIIYKNSSATLQSAQKRQEVGLAERMRNGIPDFEGTANKLPDHPET
jgi:hypothetical protein